MCLALRHAWLGPLPSLRRTEKIYLKPISLVVSQEWGLHGAHPEPASPGLSGYSSRWVGLFKMGYVVWIPSVICGKEHGPSLVKWVLSFLQWLLGKGLSGAIVKVYTADVSSCQKDFGDRPVLTTQL